MVLLVVKKSLQQVYELMITMIGYAGRVPHLGAYGMIRVIEFVISQRGMLLQRFWTDVCFFFNFVTKFHLIEAKQEVVLVLNKIFVV